MTDNDYRAMAERWIEATGATKAVLGKSRSPDCMFEAGEAIARRLLELLPPADGGEPTDEAWLRAVGMIDPELDCGPSKEHYGDRVVALDVPCEDGMGSRLGFMYSEGHDGWSWWACLTSGDGFDGSHDYLCPVPTRDHVRRFCRVFNVNLKEPTP